MRTRQRSLVGLLLALVMAVVVWWTQGDGSTTGSGADPGASSRAPSPSGTPSPSRSASPTHDYTETNTPVTEPGQLAGTDPASGLPFVLLAQLPPQAADMVDRIDAGGPFTGERDGALFENREELLPDEQRGYYAEYTVPTPGSDDRGARRIVAGDDGELYWTEDHYRSFERIVR